MTVDFEFGIMKNDVAMGINDGCLTMNTLNATELYTLK